MRLRCSLSSSATPPSAFCGGGQKKGGSTRQETPNCQCQKKSTSFPPDPPDVGNRWAQRFRRSLMLLPSLACLWRRGSGENDRSLVLIFIWRRCHHRSLRRRVRAADASGRCERPMRIEARHAALPRTDRVQIIVVRSRLGSLRAAGRHLGLRWVFPPQPPGRRRGLGCPSGVCSRAAFERACFVATPRHAARRVALFMFPEMRNDQRAVAPCLCLSVCVVK